MYLVRDTRTREHLALKRMLCQERDSTEAAHREVQVLRAVAHRNVVSLLDQVRCGAVRCGEVWQFDGTDNRRAIAARLCRELSAEDLVVRGGLTGWSLIGF